MKFGERTAGAGSEEVSGVGIKYGDRRQFRKISLGNNPQ